MIDPLLLPLANAALATYSGAVPTWQNPSATCHVFASIVNGLNTFAFKGTSDAAEWVQDFNPLEAPDDLDRQIGPVHLDSLNNVRTILPMMTAMLDGIGRPSCYIVGHSKGSREAPICHALLKAMGYKVAAGYFFEPPRAGGPMLRAYLADQTIVETQTFNAHGSDIVTLVPDGPDWCDVAYMLRLRVPDSYDISAKHVMPGVIVGIQGLQ